MPAPPPDPLGPGTDLVAWLLSLEPAERERVIDQLGPADREALDRDWSAWAHEGQLWPDHAWRTWVVKGGRGFGKTLTGANWITAAVEASAAAGGEPLSIALVGATLDEARRIMVEGRSGLLEVAEGWIEDWKPSLRRLVFKGGAVATLFSGHSPEILRGPEHHLAWCDELAKWEEAQASWDMLQLGLRLGDWPRALVTTTPRPGPVLKSIMADPDTVVTGGPSRANPHVSPAWRRGIYARIGNTRLGRQELEAELLPDAAGALWSEALLERCRLGGSTRKSVRVERSRDICSSEAETFICAGPRLRSGPPLDFARGERLPSLSPGESTTFTGSPFTRIVIAVDPPSGDGTCGIVACAKDADGRAHILADHSVAGRTPEGWARAVADAARIWSQLGEKDAEPLALSLSKGEQPPDPQPPEPAPTRPPVWVMCPEAGDYVLKPRDEPAAAQVPSPIPPRDGEGVRRKCGGGGAETPSVYAVAESNQGGEMVRAVLRTADPELRVKLVQARHGKSERASPVAMLFEAGKVTLHGRFPELEAQLCGMIAGGGYEGPGASPDRADALVWGLTELMLSLEPAPPRVRAL